MTTTYTFDVVATLDGYGSYDEHGDWGGFWGKQGPELIHHRLAQYEADQRLIDSRNVQLQNRADFFAVSAQLMRRILADFARSRGNLKRGDKWKRSRWRRRWLYRWSAGRTSWLYPVCALRCCSFLPRAEARREHADTIGPLGIQRAIDNLGRQGCDH